VINECDAKTLGIKDGDRVILYNKQGEVKMRAKVSTDVPRGVLWSPRQLIGLNNEPLNSLVKSKTQKIKGDQYSIQRW